MSAHKKQQSNFGKYTDSKKEMSTCWKPIANICDNTELKLMSSYLFIVFMS